jgi:hypothetical protein
VVLERAKIAVGALMVAQRRAAGFDRVPEHGLDSLDQVRGALVGRAGPAGNARCHAFGRKPRAVQRLADVDVAQPGDDPLIR